MGFALPLLSLTRFAFQVRRNAAMRENAMPQAALFAAPRFLADTSTPAAVALIDTREQQQSLPAFPVPEESHALPAVFTLRRSRPRRRTATAAIPAAQMVLPLQAEPACSQPRALRIVQREPSKQPECLMISGRMADVCAALERMAAREGMPH